MKPSSSTHETAADEIAQAVASCRLVLRSGLLRRSSLLLCEARVGCEGRKLLRRVVANEPFLASLREIYRAADAAAAGAGASCRACGRCCRFDEAGHLLYVTPGELALLTAFPPPALDTPRRAVSDGPHCDPTASPHAPCQGPADACKRAGRCAYQAGNLCTARDRRALGCRLFSCQTGAAESLKLKYEELHGRIRRLHAEAGVSYLYVELSGALAALGGPLLFGHA